ncbi:MAG: hypothetical protein L0K27_09745 [Corynebacterium nuruki]|jgi:hypothetical protein|nr:hypothetical protein [Corynebacterium nuruki]
MLKDLVVYAGIAALLVVVGVPQWVLVVPVIPAVSALVRSRQGKVA